MRGDQRGPTKAVCGPGGLNCNCCIRYTRGEAKVADRRIRRRKAKQRVKQELQVAQ